MFDVFVSYRHSDGVIVRRLVAALERRGLQVWFDETAIPDFGGITDEARRGLAESKALLVFYSATYPHSSPCQWELTLAFLASARLGDPRRRVLVVNPELAPSHIEPVELRDALYQTLDRADAARIEQIASSVAEHVAELTGGLGGGMVAERVAWVPQQPFGAVRFVGRQREMWRIHSALHAHLAGMTQGVVGPGVVQVSGLGGIGKSLLAREYALRFAGAFPGGVFWLDAQSDVGSADPTAQADRRYQQIWRLAVSLLGGNALEGKPPGDVEAQLRKELDGRDPCLWVVDDLPPGLSADRVHMWLGSGAARTLITTRSREYSALVAEVPLGVLEPAEALEVLTAHRQPDDDQQLAVARSMVQELGGHALALDVVGAMLRYESFGELLAHLREPGEDALELAARLREELPTGHERSISATLAHSLGRVDEAARDLLRIASLLAYEPITAELFTAILVRADGVDRDATRMRVIASLDEIYSLSLIEQTVDDGWQIHPLLARTVEIQEHDHSRWVALERAGFVARADHLADYQYLVPGTEHGTITRYSSYRALVVDLARAWPGDLDLAPLRCCVEHLAKLGWVWIRNAWQEIPDVEPPRVSITVMDRGKWVLALAILLVGDLADEPRFAEWQSIVLTGRLWTYLKSRFSEEGFQGSESRDALYEAVKETVDRLVQVGYPGASERTLPPEYLY